MIADQSLHRGFWGHQAQVGAIVQMCHDLNFRILHLRGIGQQDDDAQRRSICLIRLNRRVPAFHRDLGSRVARLRLCTDGVEEVA